eukprot:1583456-Alexandrium_andersonii.AAC.1
MDVRSGAEVRERRHAELGVRLSKPAEPLLAQEGRHRSAPSDQEVDGAVRSHDARAAEEIGLVSPSGQGQEASSLRRTESLSGRSPAAHAHVEIPAQHTVEDKQGGKARVAVQPQGTPEEDLSLIHI